MKTILNIEWSPLQCENRYKTILKRKKKAIDNNKTSGSEREDIPFEEELARIASVDDSIAPEFRIDATKYEKPKTEREKSSKRYRKEKSISEVLLELHEKQEAARERRHKEKMECIREVMKDFLKNDDKE